MIEVALQHIDLLDSADAAGQVVAVDTRLEGLNLFVGQGVAGDDDLEAVVIRRVVAAGEHHRGFAREDMAGVVDHRGRHHADIADVAAAVEQALNQLLHQFRTGQAAIAAHRDVRLALRQALRADRAADPVGGFCGQAAADHAANVVGAEDVGG
ncbi:hypothetical protein D9M68_842140 [compost metagenome]